MHNGRILIFEQIPY